MKITFFCDQCHKVMGTREVKEMNLQQFGPDSLTDQNKMDIIKYTHEAGLHLYALCDHCASLL